MENYLKPTYFLDSDHPSVLAYAKQICKGETNNVDKAVKLYLAVRDTWPYDPYNIKITQDELKASSVLKQKTAYCITKAVLLSALARAVKIPARLGFADVRNHLTTKKFRALMKTDVFVFHGFSEFYLEGKWVKATPAFNKTLCEKFGVHPLEFNGKEDSVFHEFDCQGNKHMEYVNDRGSYADVPFNEIKTTMIQEYPIVFECLQKGKAGNFESDAKQENTTNLSS